MKTLFSLLVAVVFSHSIALANDPRPNSTDSQNMGQPPYFGDDQAPSENLTGGALDDNPVYNLSTEPVPYQTKDGRSCEIVSGKVECAPADKRQQWPSEKASERARENRVPIDK